MKLFCLHFVLAVILLGGCATNRVPPIDRRVTLSPNLPRSVKVEDLNVGRNSAGLLIINAGLINSGSRPVDINYKVDWLSGGMVVDSLVGSWNRRTLRPREPVFLSLPAPRLDVDDFRMTIREDQ
ncbi:MAG: DUF1425 domain-containing protein [Opitutales bacterium]